MGWDMLLVCILKVVSIVLRNLLFISVSVVKSMSNLAGFQGILSSVLVNICILK